MSVVPGSWTCEQVYLGSGPENTAIFILKSTDVVDEQSAILKDFLEQAQDLPIALPKQKFFTTCLQKMEAESAVIKRMEEITSTKDPLQIEKVLGRAKNLELPQSELIASLEDSLEIVKFFLGSFEVSCCGHERDTLGVECCHERVTEVRLDLWSRCLFLSCS